MSNGCPFWPFSSEPTTGALHVVDGRGGGGNAPNVRRKVEGRFLAGMRRPLRPRAGGAAGRPTRPYPTESQHRALLQRSRKVPPAGPASQCTGWCVLTRRQRRGSHRLWDPRKELPACRCVFRNICLIWDHLSKSKGRCHLRECPALQVKRQ